jgi:hypothetical protein
VTSQETKGEGGGRVGGVGSNGPDVARAASDWPAPRQVPTSYPGAAPDHSYLLIDDRVVPLTAGVAGDRLAVTLADGTPVDDVLAAAGLATLGERVPILAYGSNRSPHTLAMKFSHHGTGPAEPTVAVPVLAGTMAGLDVVAAGVSSQGFVYADVVPSPGTEVSVMLTLLDPRQAAAIHDSEGLRQGAYDCARLPGFAISGAVPGLEVLAYAGRHPVFVSPETGTPLAFAAIAASGRTFAAYPQVELLGHVMEATGITGTAAAILGLAADRPAAEVAHEAARLLSGQWWYTHNTGDEPAAASVRLEELLWGAIGAHSAPQSTAERLGAEGAVLDVEVAYALGPELRLGAQVGIA